MSDLLNTIFRNVLGTKCLADILSEREKIANWMEQTLGDFWSVLTCCINPLYSDEATDPWGVKVERVEV